MIGVRRILDVVFLLALVLGVVLIAKGSLLAGLISLVMAGVVLGLVGFLMWRAGRLPGLGGD